MESSMQTAPTAETDFLVGDSAAQRAAIVFQMAN
jgi:hypothetical protein